MRTIEVIEPTQILLVKVKSKLSAKNFGDIAGVVLFFNTY